MGEKKWVKIEGTKVGADGTGYFRGLNGRYYYGNLKNGYLRETNQSRAARERRAAAQQNRSPDLLDDIDDSLSTFSEWEPITFVDCRFQMLPALVQQVDVRRIFDVGWGHRGVQKQFSSVLFPSFLFPLGRVFVCFPLLPRACLKNKSCTKGKRVV